MRIDDLETNLARTPIVARKLKAECQAFKKVIDDAVNALNKPKEVDDKLKSLSRTSKTTFVRICLILRIPPPSIRGTWHTLEASPSPTPRVLI